LPGSGFNGGGVGESCQLGKSTKVDEDYKCATTWQGFLLPN